MESTFLTMEKSVQCDNFPVVDVVMVDHAEKENQEANASDDESFPMTNGHAPFSRLIQTDLTSKEQEPLVKAISEDKHPILQNIFGKRAQDELNMEILDFHSMRQGRLNLSLLRKPASLVTVVKYQGGEFVEVKTSSSYNSSMSLLDMKKAISAALDSCISQSNEVLAPSPPRSSPKQEVLQTSSTENNSLGKNTPSKKTPPKNPKVIDGNIGTNENTKGTLGGKGTLGVPKDASGVTKSTIGVPKGTPGIPKGTPGIPKGTPGILKGAVGAPKNTVGEPKGTVGEPKSTQQVPKAAPERQKKMPEKAKETTQVVPQMSKVEVTKASKPAQAATRVKKPKIPDEESIKFANRQKEIARMKKELKEKLKREGKEGVDPATRMNAWGRTVGVTCTMCGNHVQKSYGCFRRDTAPEKLVHLFTPGMNRIKICRRCLPYKKNGAKGENESRVFSKPGLKALASEPRSLNPGASSPEVPPPVSTTTLSAIHRKVTAGQESTGNDNTAHVNVSSDHVNTSLGFVNTGLGLIDTAVGHVNMNPGHMNTGIVHMNTGLGYVNTDLNNVNTGLGDIVASHVNTDIPLVHVTSGHANNGSVHVNNGSGQVNNGFGQISNIPGHVNAASVHMPPGSVHVNTGTDHGIVSTGSGPPPAIDLGDSGKGSAIEYIRQLALNLKANYGEQAADGRMKKEARTPEDQIIKTPLYEHMSTFTPITPSMTLGNQAPSVDGVPRPLTANILTPQWKHVSSQELVTPDVEEKPSFVQGIGTSVTSPQPWGTVPIVLTSQPSTNVVLTSASQVSCDPKSMTTFVTTANQKDLKLLPAIVVPSQHALPGQGPLFLQIQRVNLVQEKTGERAESQEKVTYEGGNNEMAERSESNVNATNSGDNMVMKDIAGYIGESTVIHQSMPQKILNLQLETPTGNLEPLPKEISRDIYGYKDINTVDTIGHLGIKQDNMPSVEHVLQETQKALQDMINVANSESRYINPNESQKEQLDLPGELGISYPEPEPALVVCVSADNASTATTMYPSGYQVVDVKDNGQEGALKDPMASVSQGCVNNIFDSQVSEEYLPQRSYNETEPEDVEELNQAEKLESETVKEDNDGSLPDGDGSEKKGLQEVDVSDGKSELMQDSSTETEERGLVEDESQVMASEGKSLETTSEDISVEMKDSGEKLEEMKDSGEKVEEMKDSGEKVEEMKEGKVEEEIHEETKEDVLGENGRAENVEDGSHEEVKEDDSKPVEQPGEKAEVKEATEKEATEKEAAEKEAAEKEATEKEAAQPERTSIPVVSEESIPLDRRRSMRRTSSPRKSPSRSPSKSEKKVEPKVHGTRRTTLRKKEVVPQDTQKGKPVQQGTHKDKMGQEGLQEDKTVQLGSQKDKTVQPGTQKDEKVSETPQGVKRKRGRPPKKPKTEQESCGENVKNSKQDMSKEHRNSPSKRMKTRQDL